MLLLLACAPDDVTTDGPTTDTAADADTDTDADTDADADTQDISGAWVSAGDDLSELFANDPFDYVEVDATFSADATYTVSVRDTDGQTGTLTGTYTTDITTSPGTITLQQATPYTATASGIWQVSSGVLTYEVVQTQPDYGFTPPTPESGFGTTAGASIEPGVNVQTYRRAP
jgi:hypothetical protein